MDLLICIHTKAISPPESDIMRAIYASLVKNQAALVRVHFCKYGYCERLAFYLVCVLYALFNLFRYARQL